MTTTLRVSHRATDALVRITGARIDATRSIAPFRTAATLVESFTDERTDLGDNFKQVARGLVEVVNGLAPIRNNMSEGHARERKLEAHHARVIVNAAKTVATLLVESYLVPRERGLSSASSKAEAPR